MGPSWQLGGGGAAAPAAPPPCGAGPGGATSNQRAARETAKISSAQSKNARKYWQQPTLSSEDSATNEVPIDRYQ